MSTFLAMSVSGGALILVIAVLRACLPSACPDGCCARCGQ